MRRKIQDPQMAFFWRLYEYGKISEADFDRACGKLSGYPGCCIEYFMWLSSLGFPAGLVSSAVLGPDDKDVHYVRCPKCRGINVRPPSILGYHPVTLSRFGIISRDYFA
jgi:hypothetical protein